MSAPLGCVRAGSIIPWGSIPSLDPSTCPHSSAGIRGDHGDTVVMSQSPNITPSQFLCTADTSVNCAHPGEQQPYLNLPWTFPEPGLDFDHVQLFPIRFLFD